MTVLSFLDALTKAEPTTDAVHVATAGSKGKRVRSFGERVGKASAFVAGDRIKVRDGAAHPGMEEMVFGVVHSVSDESPLAIKFDGSDDVHQWYVGSEIEPAGAESGAAKSSHAPKAGAGGKKKPRTFMECVGKGKIEDRLRRLKDRRDPDKIEKVRDEIPGNPLKAGADLKTLYVSRPVKNAGEIIAWAKAQGFDKTVTADDLHVTVAFSRNPVEWQDAGDSFDTLKVGAADDREVKPLGDKGAVVLRFDFPELTTRWQEFRDIGCSWDFPGYQPHVTISYAASDMDLSKVEPYAGEIILGPEVFAPVDDDWTDKVVEKAGPIRFTVPITKADEDQNLVFGWASVIEENGEPVYDYQGHRISEDELEKAFYRYAEEARVAGEMHDDYGEHVGKLVEAMVFTKAKQAALGIDLGKVGAWVGYRVSPAVFAKIKDGTYRMLSIGGHSQIEDDE